jgi:hypothetical protein
MAARIGGDASIAVDRGPAWARSSICSSKGTGRSSPGASDAARCRKSTSSRSLKVLVKLTM